MLRDLARRVRYAGTRRACPICRARLRAFAPAPGRPQARCPVCGSLERHRHLWLYLEHRGLALSGTVLHVAPDAATERRLRRRPITYLAGDLEGARGGAVLDVTALDVPDGSVDLILASHVLEHVPDDAAAFAEMRRVLRPGGEALLQVPLRPGPTREDPALVDPAARRAAFGQEDHVRVYGDDLPARVRAAALDAELVVFRDELPARVRARHGLEYPVPDPEADHLWAFVRAVRPARAP